MTAVETRRSRIPFGPISSRTPRTRTDFDEQRRQDGKKYACARDQRFVGVSGGTFWRNEPGEHGRGDNRTRDEADNEEQRPT